MTTANKSETLLLLIGGFVDCAWLYMDKMATDAGSTSPKTACCESTWNTQWGLTGHIHQPKRTVGTDLIVTEPGVYFNPLSEIYAWNKRARWLRGKKLFNLKILAFVSGKYRENTWLVTTVIIFMMDSLVSVILLFSRRIL